MLPSPARTQSLPLSLSEIFTSSFLLVLQQLLCSLEVPEALSVDYFGGGPGSAHRP